MEFENFNVVADNGNKDWSEAWPEFKDITPENAGLRFREFYKMHQHMLEVAKHWAQVCDPKRWNDGRGWWDIQIDELDGNYVSFRLHWDDTYDHGNTWNFVLSYSDFCLDKAELTKKAAEKLAAEQDAKIKSEAERKKREQEVAQKRQEEHDRREWLRLQKKFEVKK